MRTLLVFLTILAVLAAAPPTDPSASRPRVEFGPCPFRTAPGERVECGMLIVPENRGRPERAQVRIPVRIFRSRAANPAPDPVLFMLGGPGGSILTTTGTDIPLLDARDYIVFDQRGTRNTRPPLECPGIPPVMARIARGLLSGEEAERERVNAAAACAERLRGEGIDLGSYNSRAIAEDVEDLRRALGIERWNLYGVSYSVRVMLTLMRDHPEAIRSVVLDSVLPLESRYDEVAAANLMRALGIVLDACSVDPACGKRHPNLRGNLASAIDRFRRKPVQLMLAEEGKPERPFVVTGAMLAGVLGDMLGNPQSAKALPAVVDRAAAGDVKALEPLFRESLYFGGYTYGQRTAVWCADVVPFEDRARIAAGHEAGAGTGGARLEAVPPAVCDALHLPAPPGIEGEAVRSTIPALLLSGEIDPYTPTPWARAMLRNLPAAFLVTFPGRGHGPGFSPCGGKIIDQFLRNPDRPPYDACLDRPGET